MAAGDEGGRERLGWPEDHAIRPLTQLGLADTLGLTSVHINRLGDHFVSIGARGKRTMIFSLTPSIA